MGVWNATRRDLGAGALHFAIRFANGNNEVVFEVVRSAGSSSSIVTRMDALRSASPWVERDDQPHLLIRSLSGVRID